MAAPTAPADGRRARGTGRRRRLTHPAQSAIWDQEIAHRQDESVSTITERIHAAVRSAVTGGELDTDAGPSDLAAMLVGPIVYRTTMQRDVVSDDLIDRLIDSVGTWHR